MSARKNCARCGTRLPADPHRRVYSPWTRSYYCAGVDACAKRANRLRKKAAA